MAITTIENLGRKRLEEIVKETGEQRRYVGADLKEKRKSITDKTEIMYLDWCLIKILDAYFDDVSDYADNFLQHMEHLEKKGYFIDDYLIKYNMVVERRISFRKYI
jgi:hypothetical protein